MGDSHVFALLGTPPAISPPLAACPLAAGQFRVGRDTEAGMHVGGDTLYCGFGSREGLRGPRVLDTQTRTSVLSFLSKGHAAAVTESQELANP